MKPTAVQSFARSSIMVLLAAFSIYSCSTSRERATQQHDPYAEDTSAVRSPANEEDLLPEDTTMTGNDTIRIANDSLEYEILIIDPGFASFLYSRAKPEGYHSQSWLENKNRFLVTDYNQRARQPFRYDPDIYTEPINYDSQVDYGYDVNYKLYYYFVYLSERYNQKFSVSTRI